MLEKRHNCGCHGLGTESSSDEHLLEASMQMMHIRLTHVYTCRGKKWLKVMTGGQLHELVAWLLQADSTSATGSSFIWSKCLARLGEAASKSLGHVQA